MDPVSKREALKRLAEVVGAEFEAKGDAATTADAEIFRDAFFWELGLTTGWRPASRARINEHHDIVWIGRLGKRMATVIANKKTELKRKVELPPVASQLLSLYIDQALPLLRSPTDGDNQFLFPGRRHGGMLVRLILVHSQSG